MSHQPPPPPPMMPPYQPMYTPPPPKVPWYHEKWFVVLSLILFFPLGIAMLWTSPKTKLVGRLVWTGILGLMVLIVATSPDAPADTTTAAPPAQSQTAEKAPTPKPEPATQKAAPAPPKEEYNFTVTMKDTGKVFKGKMVSDVGAAVLDVQTATSLGNQTWGQKAQPGAKFVVVQVIVKNEQKDAITLLGNLFTLLYDGREYSYSTEGSTALELSKETESFFLKKINPGLSLQGLVPFEVPEDLDVSKAQFQFRGGMTGKTATVPAKPITE